MTGSLDWTSLERRPLNTLCFESPSHTNTLLQGFNELRNHHHLLDVTLLADGKSFKVCRRPNCVFIVEGFVEKISQESNSRP